MKYLIILLDNYWKRGLLIMDTKKILSLFAAHTPTPEKFKLRSENAYTENMSIATLIKSPNNTMPAFNHAHSSYEFIIPHTPIPFLIRDDATYFGEIGWIYPVPPFIKHGMKYSMNDVSHTDIVFDKRFFEEFLSERCIDSLSLNLIFRTSDELLMYINVFKREFAKGNEVNTHKLNHLSSLICDEIIDLANTAIVVDERKEIQSYHKGIHAVAEFMNNNYMNALQIESLAKMANLSTNYFSTSFLNMLGDRPQVYLNKLRISKAKQFLKSSDEPIYLIAKKCGFNHQSSFTSLFLNMDTDYLNQYVT